MSEPIIILIIIVSLIGLFSFLGVFFFLVFKYQKPYLKANENKVNGFHYEFSPKEFAYFTFHEKKCPNCGSLMEQIKTCDLKDWRDISTSTDVNYRNPYGQAKCYNYMYHCHNCNSKYTLNQLSNIKNSQ